MAISRPIAIDALLLGQPDRVGPTGHFPRIIHAGDDITLLDVVALPLIKEPRDEAQPILIRRSDPKLVAFLGVTIKKKTVRTTLQFLPPPDFEATTFADFMVLGMIMTAMPAVNAIPRVVAAPPGIVTYTDLPLALPSGWVP